MISSVIWMALRQKCEWWTSMRYAASTCMVLLFHRLLTHLYPRIIYAPDTGRSTNYTELSREFIWSKKGIDLYARVMRMLLLRNYERKLSLVQYPKNYNCRIYTWSFSYYWLSSLLCVIFISALSAVLDVRTISIGLWSACNARWCSCAKHFRATHHLFHFVCAYLACSSSVVLIFDINDIVIPGI